MSAQPKLNVLMEGKLKACLNKKFRWDDGTVQTLGERLNSVKLIRKTTCTREYANKRVHLEYKKLDKPITEYTIWYDNNGKESGIDVPKLVYDSFDLPEGHLKD